MVLLIGFSALTLDVRLSSEYEFSVETDSAIVEGWAAILEMNTFPKGWGDLNVGFVNTKRLQDTLVELGWKTDHMYVKKDNLTMATVQDAVEWLAGKTGPDDVALFYIFTHGAWMQREIKWGDWFPATWARVDTAKRVLMIDTCRAAAFIEETRNDPDPHISMANCLASELAWAGIPEEGLPIVGSVWNYYFTNALRNSTADMDDDGFVSVEEAFNFSMPLVQRYMNQTVFVVPEFLQQYHDLGVFPENYAEFPHPVIDDQLAGQLCLDLHYYALLTDLNVDGVVNIIDVSIVASAFGSKPGFADWNENADVDGNGVVNIVDVTMVARDCGRI